MVSDRADRRGGPPASARCSSFLRASDTVSCPFPEDAALHSSTAQPRPLFLIRQLSSSSISQQPTSAPPAPPAPELGSTRAPTASLERDYPVSRAESVYDISPDPTEPADVIGTGSLRWRYSLATATITSLLKIISE